MKKKKHFKISDFMKTFCNKRRLFIKNTHLKKYIVPTYKKLIPQISAFMKNSIFGINRDPCYGYKKENDKLLQDKTIRFYSS